MRLFLAGLAAVALMVPLDAFAQQQPGGQRGQGQRGQGGRGGFGGFGGGSLVVQAIDKNNDGEISTEEMNNAVAALKALDKNKDGKIDREEQRPDFVGQMISRMMENDKNKDGKLSKDEVSERMQDRFCRHRHQQRRQTR